MPPPRTSVVALWSGMQCAALVVGATGVRLWPHHPAPPESLALAELVAVQMVASALLFPLLVSDRSTALVNVALIAPAIQSAGLLSSVPQRNLFCVTAFVAVWMMGLSGWAQLSPRGGLGRAWLASSAALLTVGGVLLWYVRAEWAAQGGTAPPDPAMFGPLMAAVTRSATPAWTGLGYGWLLDSVPATTVIVTAAWRTLRNLEITPST